MGRRGVASDVLPKDPTVLTVTRVQDLLCWDLTHVV